MQNTIDIYSQDLDEQAMQINFIENHIEAIKF